MKFQIKGNYHSGSFDLPPVTGPKAVENIITRYCPAELNLKLWECPVDYQAVEKVIASANNGFKIWKKTAQLERNILLGKYHEEVSKRKDEIASAISHETGKPVWEAKIEVSSTIDNIKVILNDSIVRIRSKTIENILPKTTGHIFYKPIGPSLIIGPSNPPCELSNGQIISALAAGNSVIFKPSEKTSYSAQLLIECFHEAGFPPGVINLIQGEGEIARRLLKDRSIRAVFFTGSKEVGKKILEITHHDLAKLVSLELGGKNTTIIHGDANLNLALIQTLRSSFLSAGQRCTSTSLVAIERKIHEKFISNFHELSKKIVIDHPVDFQREPFMGPLIDQASVDSYLLFMGMAKREGIQEIMRGKQIERPKKGHYVSPSIHFADKWNSESHFLQSEIFGPNVTFIPYDTIEEAIQIANSTEYGLAASVFTRSHSLYQNCIDEIEAGIVNYNHSTLDNSNRLPSGGVKNSGNFRPSGINTIDACVYQMAGLEVVTDEEQAENLHSIVGLNL
jgi:succinylglutamic semialdehyde dehydrogenase